MRFFSPFYLVLFVQLQVCCNSNNLSATPLGEYSDEWYNLIESSQLIEARSFDVTVMSLLPGEELKKELVKVLFNDAGLAYSSEFNGKAECSIIGKLQIYNEREVGVLLLEKYERGGTSLILLTLKDAKIADGIILSSAPSTDEAYFNPTYDMFLRSSSIVSRINDYSLTFRIIRYYFPLNNHTIDNKETEMDWVIEEYSIAENGRIELIDN